VNLYFSTMGVHVSKDSVDYDAFVKICDFVQKTMMNRVTQMFGSVWGIVKGGVPSGAFNTSHMDSWIMAMYFCLFLTFQLMNAPPGEEEEMEEYAIHLLRIVVYGDDHLYNKGEGKYAEYFSGGIFAQFMKEHFGVVVRDLKDGLPFISKVKDGWILEEGATLLKHQFVINHNKSKGQATFLPFRESREIMIRAIWSRETKIREPLDVLMSVIGQAYATFAANRDAYERLLSLYVELIKSIENIGGLEQAIEDRLNHNDLKKIRQAGITKEELIAGFPTWQRLEEKNVYDEAYQEVSNMPFDFLEGEVGEAYY